MSNLVTAGRGAVELVEDLSRPYQARLRPQPIGNGKAAQPILLKLGPALEQVSGKRNLWNFARSGHPVQHNLRSNVISQSLAIVAGNFAWGSNRGFNIRGSFGEITDASADLSIAINRTQPVLLQLPEEAMLSDLCKIVN